MGIVQTLAQADAIGRAVALLLLLMSVASWVVILWKGWLLRRAAHDLQQGTAAFWQAADLDDAQRRLAVFDQRQLIQPLVQAARSLGTTLPGTLAAAGDRSQQLTRVLRDALHAVLNRLQFGQVLLGTVWGIYHALTGIGQDGSFRIEQVSGPVGEALIMTAAGLAVAIPAVLAYNVLGRQVARIEADLEGFARDLRELLCHPDSAGGPQA